MSIEGLERSEQVRGGGVVDRVERALAESPDPRTLPLPDPPEVGPFRRSFWRSPLRGPWLASFLSAALLPLIVVCAVTGFLSHVAYETELGSNAVAGPDGLLSSIYSALDWPAGFAWAYALTQGLHVICGVAAIPILFAKLWTVIPKLWERPAVRSLAHALERVSLALLVGGSLFVFFTGLLNIQLYYPWKFSFVPAHYYGAFIFIAALAAHVMLKLPVMRRAFRDNGVLRPLRSGLAQTEPEPSGSSESAPVDPRPPTISRRGFLGGVGVTSLGLGLMAASQSVGGPFRRLAILAPHGRDYGSGPNAFQVNKTALSVGIKPAETGPSWRLQLHGTKMVTLTRDELLALPQSTQKLPIACVEGWSTTQTWTGVRLRDLARMAGVPDPASVLVESLQKGGAFSKATLNSAQARDDRSLLALKVNGADLALDHGFPARVIVPALPGVHNTKWVAKVTFAA